MIMWVMSDRAIPRSFRMMEGFGVHTFRLVNERGESRFVKFHWKPLLGVHSVLWDEAQKISGKDPDFHRRDLWEAIESGAYPEWELGLQIIEEADEHAFDFDLLDATKIVPEELVPVQRVGPADAEPQPGQLLRRDRAGRLPSRPPRARDRLHGNDPLLQGRLFSYTDTQLIRLGGPNFHEIPVNRPVAPGPQQPARRAHAADDQRQPDELRAQHPRRRLPDAGGTARGRVRQLPRAHRCRRRSACGREKFFDHFSQATLFWNSQSDPEKEHIVQAFRFELGKLEVPAIRERMVGLLAQVDHELASRVAQGLGLSVPARLDGPLNRSVPADAEPEGVPAPRRQAAGRGVGGAEHGEYRQGQREDPEGGHPRRGRRGREGRRRDEAAADRGRGSARRSWRPGSA